MGRENNEVCEWNKINEIREYICRDHGDNVAFTNEYDWHNPPLMK